MKVKVGDKVFDYREQPIMIILTDQDKENIANMPPDAYRYCLYPTEHCTEEEILEWMLEEMWE